MITLPLEIKYIINWSWVSQQNLITIDGELFWVFEAEQLELNGHHFQTQ
jgi:hypothetical protein